MRKITKKSILTKTLAMMMTFVLFVMMAFQVAGVSVKAANPEGTVSATGTNKAGTDSSLAIHALQNDRIFQVYQVFKGDYSGGVLSNIEWGVDVDSDKLVNSLLEEAPFAEAFATAGYSSTKKPVAGEVAKVLNDMQIANDSETAIAFANLAGKALLPGATPIEINKCTATQTPAAGYQYKVTDLKAGYYLVNEKTPTGTGENREYTRYILKVAGDASATIKARTGPDIDKNISAKEGNAGEETYTGQHKYEDLAIGDVVTYTLNTKVPDMKGYTQYGFVIDDTMSKGLTYVSDTDPEHPLVVKVGNTTLTKDTDYTAVATKETDGTTKLHIVFKDFYNKWKGMSGTAITVTYAAQLNENAVVGTTGNPNTVHLTYSTDPTYTGEGDDITEPGNDAPKGQTPDRKTYVYTTELRLFKHNKDMAGLAGATFKLTGNTLNNLVVVSEKFEAAADGTFYKLKDGTYTTEDPNAPGMDQDKYDSTTTKYKIVNTTEKVAAENANGTYSYTYTTPDTGIVYFKGLTEGHYELEELVAPAGYDKLQSKIQFDLAWSEPTIDSVEHTCTWTITNEAGEVNILNTQELVNGLNDSNAVIGMVNVRVENTAGSSLPETGGAGTVLIYVLGIIFAIGASVILVSKRRMKMVS